MSKFQRRILVSTDLAEATAHALSRRGFLVGAAGVAGMAALAACGASSSGETSGASQDLSSKAIEKSMILSNFSDYVNKADLTSFTSALGPTVELELFSSGEELIAKLNGGGAKYDVVVGGTTEINQMRELKLLRKIDRSLVPNFKNVLPAVQDQDFDPGTQYSVPKSIGIVGFYWLPSSIKGAEQAESLGDMFEVIKQNKGKKICLFDSAKELYTIALAAVGKPINSEKQSDIDLATKALIELKPMVTTYSMEQTPLMEARQIDLGLGYTGATLQANKVSTDNPYSFQLPSKGTTEYFLDNWAIPTAGRSPVAAHAFINYMCDPKIAASEMNEILYTAPIDGIAPYLDPAIADLDYLNPTDAQLQQYSTIVATPTYLNLVAKAFAEFKAA